MLAVLLIEGGKYLFIHLYCFKGLFGIWESVKLVGRDFLFLYSFINEHVSVFNFLLGLYATGLATKGLIV